MHNQIRVDYSGAHIQVEGNTVVADYLTRSQLEDAVTILYQRFKDEPEAFDKYTEPRADALALVANIFEIANTN